MVTAADKKAAAEKPAPARKPAAAKAREGYPVIVKLAVPPDADYHSGASLILQGDSLADVSATIGDFVGEAEVGETIVRDIVEFNLKGAVARSLSGDAPAPEPAATVEVPADAPVVTTSKVGEGAPGDDEPASEALLKVVAKKTGQEVSDITKAEALALIKGVKK